MKCPDIDLLIELGDQDASRVAASSVAAEPAVREHLDTCADCRDAVRLVESVRESFRPSAPVPVPGHVVARAQAMVFRRAAARRAQVAARQRGLRPIDLWCAGALGAAAVLATILATKPVDPGAAIVELALLALAGGGVASWLQKRNWQQEVGVTLAASSA